MVVRRVGVGEEEEEEEERPKAFFILSRKGIGDVGDGWKGVGGGVVPGEPDHGICERIRMLDG